MFSNLGPLFRTTFRQAESNDTRQHIPHEEIDKTRRKKEDPEKKKTDDELWQDNTVVTIPALRAFLINFLKTMPEAQNTDLPDLETPPEQAYTRPKETARPTNTQNAKAVRAYQSMAAQSKEPQRPKEENKGPTYRRPPSADMVKSKELRNMYQLIENLDRLATSGVETLTITKAGTFVESLTKAVANALTKI